MRKPRKFNCANKNLKKLKNKIRSNLLNPNL